MMEEQNIPIWLNTWQSEFLTCFDVWTELKEKAQSHRLSPDQKKEMKDLIQRRILWGKKASQADREHRIKDFVRIYKDEINPLDKFIHEYWEKNGYYDLRFMKNGKMGLRSSKGGILLTPEYEDISFTYDEDDYILDFFYISEFPVKKDGKWGIVNHEQEILIPFEYDFIFRKPGSRNYYVLIKEGKQGLAEKKFKQDENGIDVVVSVEMDAIYHVPGWDLILFTKGKKWGWWFWNYNNYYVHYSDPKYDHIYVPPIEEIRKAPDDADNVFTVQKGNQYFDIPYDTIK